MKLTLFSQNITEEHKQMLLSFLNKPFSDVRFLYINTAGNHKPFKSEWMLKSEQNWRTIFPRFQEFDLERAYRVDQKFNFKEFFNSYDYIYVSGGVVYLLSYWMKKTGSDKIIKKLILKNKIVYGGGSAGAIYAYKEIDSYKQLDKPELALEKIDESLGVIDFAPLPHWQNIEYQEGLEMIKYEFEKNGVKTYPITDNQALFIDDNKIITI